MKTIISPFEILNISRKDNSVESESWQTSRMRPDEHKKKRSAQYQRKHGGTGGGAKGEKSGKDKQDKASSKPGKAGSARAEKMPQTSCSALPNKKVHSSTSETESEVSLRCSVPQINRLVDLVVVVDVVVLAVVVGIVL